MDMFQKIMSRQVGVKGLKCSCCNRFHGKSKKLLRRIARAKMKARLRQLCSF